MKKLYNINFSKEFFCHFHEFFSDKNPGSSDYLVEKKPSFVIDFEYEGFGDTKFPNEYLSQLRFLRFFALHHWQMKQFPIDFCQFTYLKQLHLSALPINVLPDEFENLVNLSTLKIEENIFKELPAVIFRLRSLQILGFNAFAYTPQRVTSTITVSHIMGLYKVSWNHLEAAGFNETALANLLEQTAIENKDALSNSDEIGNFCSGLYNLIPRMVKVDFSDCNLKLITETLTHLDLKNQAFEILDNSIGLFRNLIHLDISANYMLQEISPVICSLPLRVLNLQKCPALKTPPKEIISKGLTAILGYMRRLLQGSTKCRRTKLMVVGLGGAGKTTLTQRMMLNDKKERITTTVTDGITINKWLVKSVEYSIWDFAGQTVYYNTHQFFLSNRAVYLLLWNVRLGHQHAGLEFWLSSIECHAPKAPIFLVGTHIDEV